MKTFLKVTAASALVLGLAACADSRTAQRATPPGPGDLGAFAYDDGELHRLSTSSNYSAHSAGTWSDRVSLGPDARFVVQDPALTFGTADLERRIRLVRVYHPRDVAYAAPGERSGGIPEWVRIDAAPTQAVPVSYDTYGPMQTDSETGQYTRIIEVIPRNPLTPGMYALYIEGQETSQLARFGVDWTEADKVAFDSTSCVTNVTGSDVTYQPCPAYVATTSPASWVGASTMGASTAAALVPASSGLELRLLDQQVSQTFGGISYLIASGEITNTSGQVLNVPPVKVSLRDAAGGALLSEWEVTPQHAQLQPGAMTRFDASVPSPREPARLTATLY